MVNAYAGSSERRGGRWCLNLYPTAAEAGGCFSSGRRREPTSRGGSPDVARSQQEAARRARGALRRYCAANRLNRLATLTYAVGCFDHLELRADVSGFFRGLRRELRGEPLPYAWTSEWHPGGHGLHVHFAVGRYVRQSLIRDVWGRGITHIKLIGDLPVGSGALGEARIAARYLAKYVSKNVADERVPRLHRYEVAEGFQPAPIFCAGESADDVIGQASGYMNQLPAYEWRSSTEQGWAGPPAYWCAWTE